VGTLTGQQGRVGIAVLRLSAAGTQQQASDTLVLEMPEQQQQVAVRVVPQRPGWWPADWGREEEQQPQQPQPQPQPQQP
jgi:hypothetical protein